MHIRARVRHKLADLLSGIAAVTANRTTPLQVSELPCITIHARGESVNEVSNSRRQQRVVDVFVDVYVRGAADLDDLLDAKAALVEQAIAAAPKLDGLADKVVLQDTVLDETKIGEVTAGVVRLHFSVICQTPFGQPES